MATTKTIQATVKNRTDTATNWTQKNPVLAEGEIIVVQTSAGETRLKIGDGVKTFTQLPYTDEQIYNNVVTSVNGQTGDVTLTDESKSLGITSASVGQIPKVKAVDSNGAPTEWEAAAMPSGGGTGTSVQSDWNQNDTTASDYIKNRPGGYEKQISINIDTDIIAGMEGLINLEEDGCLYRLPVDNINDLQGAKIGSTQSDAVIIDSIYEDEETLQDKKIKVFGLITSSSSGTAVAGYLYKITEDNTALDDDNTIFVDKGTYILTGAVGSHLYISNNGTVKCPIDMSLLPIKSGSDYMGVLQRETGLYLTWNLGFNKEQLGVSYASGEPELYIQTGDLYKAGTGIAISWTGSKYAISGAYKAGNGISISNDGTISSSSSDYIINVTIDTKQSSIGNWVLGYSCTCDKTYAEVLAAYQSGEKVIAHVTQNKEIALADGSKTTIPIINEAPLTRYIAAQNLLVFDYVHNATDLSVSSGGLTYTTGDSGDSMICYIATYQFAFGTADTSADSVQIPTTTKVQDMINTSISDINTNEYTIQVSNTAPAAGTSEKIITYVVEEATNE